MKPTIWTYCTGIVRACHWWVAAGLLVLMFGLGITSMSHMSAIADEEAHIPAGYSYVKYHDYRLNPEHPPLIKVLSAIPLQFMHLQFPLTSPDWTTEPNGEWDVGEAFLYGLGNNASQIIFWARLPVLLLTIAFGAFFYWVNRRRYGLLIAGLGLFFYTLSPNMIANGTLVTTDLGAAALIFVALVAFERFVERPGRRSLIIFSIALAVAQLAKFSGVFLYPFLGLMTLLWLLWRPRRLAQDWPWKKFLGGFILACVISLAIVYVAYLPEVWNTPTSVQRTLISASLPGQPAFVNPLLAIANLPGGKPVAQFLLGLVMDTGRIEGGNVTYFWGQTSNGSFPLYFPALILTKTQLSFLILWAVTGVTGLVVAWRARRRLKGRLRVWLAEHFWEATLGLFIFCYLALAISGNLDLGIRHILPIYPPLFVLVALGIAWLWRRYLSRGKWRRPALVVLGGLLIWYAAAALWIYPNYLAYFNELIGGPANADKYFSDSSIDWGQGLLEVQQYLHSHPQIHLLALDYFGGADATYYFCNYAPNGQLIAVARDGANCTDNKITIWHSNNGPYPGQYIAVSETYLENDRYYAAQVHEPGYAYLRAKTPIAKIGYSIYLYKLY